MNTTQDRMITAPTAPVIELKKFQFAEFASEETNCYSCEVWVNGKPGFTARNEGHGGCDFYEPIYSAARGERNRAAYDEAMALIKAYCAARPPLLFHGTTLDYTVDLFIGEAVEEMLRQRDRQKILRKRKNMVLILEGETLRQSKKIEPARMAAAIAHFQSKYPKAVILNTLSEEAAMAILKAKSDRETEENRK